MDFAGLNYLAVVLAAIASFMFGGLWYGLLSKQWLDAIGKTEAQIKTEAGEKGTMSTMPVLFGITFIAQLIMAWVLAGMIGHLGKGLVTPVNGIISAAFIWCGFVATTLVVNHGYQMSKRSLTLIDGGHWLGVLLIQGLIIGWWGV